MSAGIEYPEGSNFVLLHMTDDGIQTYKVSDRDSWLTASELREKFDIHGGLIELRRKVGPNTFESICAPGLARKLQ